MKRKTHARKVRDAATRKALRARILRVLNDSTIPLDSEVPTLPRSTCLRLAALQRELDQT